jgi:hypothetical protein
MFVRRLLLLITLSLVLISNKALAQSVTTTQGQQSSPAAVAASVSANGRIRFTSPGLVTQIRLEIYNTMGVMVYDSGLRQGGIIDWRITDATQPVTDGSYLCVVSIKDLQGKLRQRLGALAVQSGQLTLQRPRAESLTADQSQVLAANRQAQKIESADNNDAITILTEGKTRSVTITAHDGQDGQVTSTNGSLTFRTGDIFSSQDKEQMRITPEGQVGIGTDKPEATLDVAGTIRARGGIRFDDGTVLTSAGVAGQKTPDSKALLSSGVNPTANAAGTGTTNNLVKWSDGLSGIVGDSSIIDVGGNVGIGTSSPSTKLDLVGTLTLRNTLSSPGFKVGDRVSAPGTQMVYGAAAGSPFSVLNTFVQGSTLAAPTISQFSAWTSDIDTDPNNATQFTFGHFPAQGGVISTVAYGAATANKISIQPNWNGSTTPTALVVSTNGNVGIGTSIPGSKLHVVGNIKLSGASNGIIFPDGSMMSSANGNAPSGSNIVSSINDPATVGAINDNRLSTNLARLNGANNWSGTNIFSAGLSANGAPISGVGNPVNPTDAANKGYIDSNFIKINPVAPQVSVGDANGTAPILNLRGGSTCCSGPGGFTPADFKVFQNGSFVATGNLGIGTIPVEGQGYRTMWYTYKGAFRSGYAANEWDDANTGFFSWAGGSQSTASGLYSFSFGDTNFATSTSSIAFGSGNEVKGAAGFSAGAGNRVCDTYGVAFGNKAQSGGPLINGRCDPDTFNITGLAAVAIGYNVTADKDHSTAMGKFASNNGFSGTFVWSDGSATASADTFRNTANNEFAARATGGFRFRTNLTGTTGCNLPAGSGVFNCTSSRYTKENFMMVNGEDVLSRLRKIPVSTWNYISEGGQARHMGPMAEDFYQFFGLGTGNTSIGVQDLAGVSLAAVKALEMRTTQLQQKSAEVDKLRTEVNELRSANASLEQRLAALEQNAQKNTRTQKKAQGRRR